MWTVSEAKDLPFQEENVAAHYGFSGNVEVIELRAHSVSPGGKFCAGTCSFIPKETTEDLVVRGFILKNSQPDARVPSWEVVPDFPIPSTWRGYSIRGINDNGDISGFFLSLSDPPPPPPFSRLYIKRWAHEPAEIEVPPAGPMPFGTVWDISNARFCVGEYYDEADEFFKGFTAKFRPDGTIDASKYSEIPVCTRIKSFNDKKNLLYVKDGIHFFELGKGPRAGQAVDITNLAIFDGRGPVTMNGINDSGYVAGFYGPLPPPARRKRQSALLQIDNLGQISHSFFSHPDFPNDTRLFSISDGRIVVGVAGETRPFFLTVKNS